MRRLLIPSSPQPSWGSCWRDLLADPAGAQPAPPACRSAGGGNGRGKGPPRGRPQGRRGSARRRRRGAPASSRRRSPRSAATAPASTRRCIETAGARPLGGRPRAGPGAAPADPDGERIGHPAVAREPPGRHRRGLRRPAAHGAKAAARRAGAARGHAGGRARLDPPRRRPARASRRDRDARRRSRGTRAAQGGHRQDRQTLGTEAAALRAEQDRLAALMAARQGRIAEAERSVVVEREKAAELARQAGSLKELIDRMEREIGGAQRAAEEARKAAEVAGEGDARALCAGCLPRSRRGWRPKCRFPRPAACFRTRSAERSRGSSERRTAMAE